MKPAFKGFHTLLLTAIIAFSFLSAEAARAQPPIRVVVYGDSLLSGYQLQPEQAFAAKLDRKLKEYGFMNVDVINMSVPGETTTGGLERLQSVLDQRPDVVVLGLGANDALRGIPTNILYKNLSEILSKFVQNRIYTVFIGMKAPSNMGYSYTAQLEQSFRTLADVYKTDFYPFALEGVVGNPELNLADGYHPNAKGVDVMVERIYPHVDNGVRSKWNANAYQQNMNDQMQQHIQDGGVALPSASPQVSSPEIPPIPQGIGDR
jgi:acyl-CoA thioesterase-1